MPATETMFRNGIPLLTERPDLKKFAITSGSTEELSVGLAMCSEIVQIYGRRKPRLLGIATNSALFLSMLRDGPSYDEKLPQTN